MFKRMTKILVVLLFVVMFSGGCLSQTGGVSGSVVDWDKDGFHIGRIETNGTHVAVGKDADVANERFNDTINQKGERRNVRDAMKRGVIRNAAELRSFTNSIFDGNDSVEEN